MTIVGRTHSETAIHAIQRPLADGSPVFGIQGHKTLNGPNPENPTAS